MRPLLVHPRPVPGEVARILDSAGHPWTAIADAAELDAAASDDGWSGALIRVGAGPTANNHAWELCEALRSAETPVAPIVLLIDPSHLPALAGRDRLFDEFCISPFRLEEVERRLAHALWRERHVDGSEDLVVYEDLVLNVGTYEAEIAGRPMELTYMEYELLKYLASTPGRVFTREVLLSQVWGYDYFGGARTVDVHIRRLRAKLGDEGAGLIQTVRSVGYSLGRADWKA